MVLDTWIECDDRFPGLKSRTRRHYVCKNRAAVAAESPEAAALAAFTSFVRHSHNDRFEVRNVRVFDPEKSCMRGYHVVMRDGRPFISRIMGYGDHGRPEEIAVPDEPKSVYGEALRLAREWQAREDYLDAARLAALAAAQTQEGKQCR